MQLFLIISSIENDSRHQIILNHAINHEKLIVAKMPNQNSTRKLEKDNRKKWRVWKKNKEREKEGIFGKRLALA